VCHLRDHLFLTATFYSRFLFCFLAQDINTAFTSPYNRDGHYVNTATQEGDATQIARAYGLDTSLYTPYNTDCASMSRSYEALNAWRSPDITGKADWLQEVPCGTVHFTAAYFQRNKK
jgi:hypothetical protein